MSTQRLALVGLMMTVFSATAYADVAEPTGDAGSQKAEADGGKAEDAGDGIPEDSDLDVDNGNAQCVPTLQDLQEACKLAGGELKNCKCVKVAPKPDAGIGKGEDKGTPPKADGKKDPKAKGPTVDEMVRGNCSKLAEKYDAGKGLSKRMFVAECLLVKHQARLNRHQKILEGLRSGKDGEPGAPGAPGAPGEPGADSDEVAELRERVKKTEHDIEVIKGILDKSGNSPASLANIEEMLKKISETQDAMDKSIADLVKDVEELKVSQKEQDEKISGLIKTDEEHLTMIKGLSLQIGRTRHSTYAQLTLNGGFRAHSPVTLQNGDQLYTLRSPLSGMGPGVEGALGYSGALGEVRVRAGFFGRASLRWDGVDIGNGVVPATGFSVGGGPEILFGATRFDWIMVGLYGAATYDRINALPQTAGLTSIGGDFGVVAHVNIPIFQAVGLTGVGRCGGGPLWDGTDVYQSGRPGPIAWTGWGGGGGCTLGIGGVFDGTFPMDVIDATKKVASWSDEGKVKKPSKVKVVPPSNEGEKKVAMR